MKAWLVLILSVILSSCGGSNSSSSTSLLSDTNSGSGAEPNTPANPAAFKLICEEAQFIKLLNMYRVSLGKTALTVSKAAVIAGRWHAQDMINLSYFDHNEPSGRTPDQRGTAFGALIVGENIAAGNSTANSTFCQWKNSPGHNSNMLSTIYKSTGVGRAVGGSYRHYWSSNFGPNIIDAIAEPLTLDVGCAIPAALPSCT